MTKLSATVRDKVLLFEFSSKCYLRDCLNTIVILYENRQPFESMGSYFPISSALKWIRETNGRIKDECQRQFIQLVLLHYTKCVYVVAYVKGELKAKLHGLRHARFFTDHMYHLRVEHVWKHLESGVRHHLMSVLDIMGCPENMWVDEFQAFITTERQGFFGCQNEKQLHKVMLKL